MRWRWRWRKGKGRPPAEIIIRHLPKIRSFGPNCGRGECVELSLPELEAVRLVDFEDMSYEEAAELMGTSRATVWRLVKSARRKIMEAIINGKSLYISDEGVEKP